jgi:tripartite ATP-independent transporter DctP family solute receptor
MAAPGKARRHGSRERVENPVDAQLHGYMMTFRKTYDKLKAHAEYQGGSKMTKIGSLLRIAAVAGAALCIAATSAAVAKDWRGWNIHAPGFPNTIALEDFAKAVTEKTNGELTLKVYNNGVLGNQPDAIEQTRNGALDFANFNLGPMGPIVPMTNVVSLPFLFSSEEQMHHAMDGEIGKRFSDAMEKKGLLALSYFDSGSRSMFNNVRPINTPADVKGMKVRVMNNQLYVDMMAALGGNATPLAMGEVYQSLKTGVVDGAENNYPTYEEYKLNEVAKYYSTTKHLIIPECLCVSKASWDQLSPETQTIVRQAAIDAAQEQRKLWAAASDKAKQDVIAQGAQVNEISDLTPFQEAMAPVYDKFYKDNPDLKAVVEEIRAIK